MSRRSTGRAVASVAAAWLVLAPAASAVPLAPGDYRFGFEGGTLELGTTPPITMNLSTGAAIGNDLGTIRVPGSDPAPVSMPATNFPAIAGSSGALVSIEATVVGDVTGTLTPSSGDMTLALPVAVTAKSGPDFPESFQCSLGTASAPLTFNVSTSAPGSPFVQMFLTGFNAWLADPNVAIPALTDCTGTVDTATVNAMLGLPLPAGKSVMKAYVRLLGPTAIPTEPVQPSPEIETPATPQPPAVAVGGGNVVVRRGIATVKVTCTSGEAACAGVLTLEKRGTSRQVRTVRLGRATFSIPVGRSRNVAVRLSRTANAMLSKSRRIRALATARVSGAASAFTRQLTLRAAKR